MAFINSVTIQVDKMKNSQCGPGTQEKKNNKRTAKKSQQNAKRQFKGKLPNHHSRYSQEKNLTLIVMFTESLDALKFTR